jgi:hypothetical protein
MTLTLVPKHGDSPRLRRRSPREGTGERYYGYDLRRVIEAQAVPPMPWTRSTAIVVIVAVALAVGIAALIVTSVK